MLARCHNRAFAALLSVAVAIFLALCLAPNRALASQAAAVASGSSASSNAKLSTVEALASSDASIDLLTGAHFEGGFDLWGKRVLIVGDSIQDRGRYNMYGSFIQRTCEKINAKKIVNKSRLGAPLANVATGVPSVYKQVMAEVTANRLGTYDYYFIAGGTNDYGKFKGKGCAKGGSVDSTDITTTCGSLNVILDTIEKAHKKATGKSAKVVVLTPIGRYRYSSAFDRDCDTAANRVDNRTLASYRNLITRTARRHNGVVVINGIDIATPNDMLGYGHSYEGLHPKALYARVVLAARLKTQLDKNESKLRYDDDKGKASQQGLVQSIASPGFFGDLSCFFPLD